MSASASAGASSSSCSSSVVDSDGDLLLSFPESEDEIVNRLKRLRQESRTTKIRNLILLDDSILQVDRIADALVETLEYFTGYPKWNMGLFGAAASLSSHAALEFVVSAAVRTERFETLQLQNQGDLFNQQQDLDATLASVVRHSSTLQKLQLTQFCLSESHLQLLAQSLITPITTTLGTAAAATRQHKQQQVGGLRQLQLEYCDFGSGNRRHYSAADVYFHNAGGGSINPCLAILATGLLGNGTLESLQLFGGYDMEDAEVAIVLRGLLAHSTLERLELSEHEYGPEAMNTISRIFSLDSICRIKHLKLSGHRSFRSGMGMYAGGFTPVLNPTSTPCPLVTLDLSQNGLSSSDANLLLRAIRYCPHLKRFDISNNQIDDWTELIRDLEVVESTTTTSMPASSSINPTMTWKSALSILNLEGNPCCNDVPAREDPFDENHPMIIALMALLRTFDRLGFLGQPFMEAFWLRPNGTAVLPLSMAHVLDWRRCFSFTSSEAYGARRRGIGSDVPHCLWPMVLAKPHRDQELAVPENNSRTLESLQPLQRQASVVFRVLQEYGASIIIVDG